MSLGRDRLTTRERIRAAHLVERLVKEQDSLPEGERRDYDELMSKAIRTIKRQRED